MQVRNSVVGIYHTNSTLRQPAKVVKSVSSFIFLHLSLYHHKTRGCVTRANITYYVSTNAQL